MSVIAYTDTRGLIDRPRTFTEVLLEGIAPGGGLFVPQDLPHLGPAELRVMAALPYAERAALVYETFGLDVSTAHVHRICSTAYGANFAHPQVAPVRDLGDGRFVLELWHGPTLAFKDMALQCMPLFFSQALEQAHQSGASQLDYLILVPPAATPAWRRSTASPIAPTRASSSTTRTPASRPCRNGR